MSFFLSNWQVYLALALSGLFSGLGSAVGAYFANKGIINHLELIINKFKKQKVTK